MSSPNRRHDRSSFFKYTGAAATKSILSGRAMRWSSPILFNDPFDIPREAILGFSVEELFEEFIAQFLRFLNHGGQPGSPMFAHMKKEVERLGIPPRKVAEIMSVTSRLVKARLEKSLEDFKSTWAEIVPRLRILCMSELPDGPSMWAHYADNHHGAVLEFRASDELDSPWLLAKPVIYRAEAPVLPGADYWTHILINDQPVDWIEFFDEYLYTKTPQWAPEKEWRTVSLAPETETGLYNDQGFHADELISVRLGERMPKADAKAIVELVKLHYPNVTIWKAVADHVARSISFWPIEHAAT